VLLARPLEAGPPHWVAGAAFVTIARKFTASVDCSLPAVLVVGAGVVLSVGPGSGDVVGVVVGVGLVVVGAGVGVARWPGADEQVAFGDGVADMVPAPDGAMSGGF
jgi:hypothetical protein